MAQPNFQYAKRQRDLNKKKKQEEKKQRKLDKVQKQPNEDLDPSQDLIEINNSSPETI
ncbi:MAG: hypothetical protein ITD42_06350 [Nitrosospira sp.]|nr:hypothetical protein [Nitrosospira sp.]MDW7643228.1 hypothetical protein [Nitrosomonadaceae bacterium]MBI0407192.1 hypothetical protein [Nitrosospira sp.]MBI0415165.1 hypothetical protein [Nitrosospira sp.]MBI0416749.1 hypothetical protein [Nitrosospira sp.]